jgi:gliding motility-associated-like protein
MRVTVLDTNGCYLSKDINVPAFPAPIINNITTRPAVCNRNNGAIAINAESGAGKLTYSLDKFNYQNSNLYDNIKGRNYTVYVKDSLDCIVSKDVKVEDIPPPTIDSLIIKPATCFKDNGAIEIIASGKGGQILYSLNGGNYVNTSRFNDLKRGLYTIAVKDTNNCLVAQKVTVPNAAPIVVELIESTPSVCDQNTGKLFIKAKGGMGKISYALNNDKFQADNTFPNLQRGEYRITIKDSANCQLDTLAKVQSDCGIYVPNIFSPNEDGVNDFLSFYGDATTVEKVLTYKIFNRWGNLIYDNPNVMMNNAGDGWNGKVNGTVLQNDVYVYIIEVMLKDGRYVQKKGDVLLAR